MNDSLQRYRRMKKEGKSPFSDEMKQAMKPKRNNNRESELQKSFVQWFRLQYKQYSKLLFAIPNGAWLHGSKTTRAKLWNKMQAEGVEKGVADLFLSIPSGDLAGLYIETKTEKGKQSKEQKQFEKQVLKVGYGYCICRSFDQFQMTVKNYLQRGEY